MSWVKKGALIAHIIIFIIFLGVEVKATSRDELSNTGNLSPYDLVKNSTHDKAVLLPEGYKHVKVQEQILRYRKIYDAVDYEREHDCSCVHIEGLYDILKNGFALVHDYIQLHEEFNRNKEQAINRIKKLFAVACAINDAQKMTQNCFVTLNLFLASIVDGFKGIESSIKEIMCPFPYGMQFEDLTTLDLKGYILYQNQKRWYQHPIHQETMHIFCPPLIIYSQGISVISPKTFVEQTLNFRYRSGLLLFDVNSRKPLQSGQRMNKSDPHGSLFNGTFFLLRHDLLHIQEQLTMETFSLFEFNLNWCKYLRKINHYRMTQEKSNPENFVLLTNGLFILCHELINVAEGRYNTFIQFQRILPQKAAFTDVISYIQKSMMNAVVNKCNISKNYYYLSSKDHEFVLKQMGQKFLPSSYKGSSKDEKREFLRQGYKEFWNLFLKLVSLVVT